MSMAIVTAQALRYSLESDKLLLIAIRHAIHSRNYEAALKMCRDWEDVIDDQIAELGKMLA